MYFDSHLIRHRMYQLEVFKLRAYRLQGVGWRSARLGFVCVYGIVYIVYTIYLYMEC